MIYSEFYKQMCPCTIMFSVEMPGKQVIRLTGRGNLHEFPCPDMTYSVCTPVVVHESNVMCVSPRHMIECEVVEH